MPSPRASSKKSVCEETSCLEETPPRNANGKSSMPVRFGTHGFPSPLDRIRSNHFNKIESELESSSSLTLDFKRNFQELSSFSSPNTRKNRSFDYNQSFPIVRHNNRFEEFRLKDCEVYKNAEQFTNPDVETTQRSFGSNSCVTDHDISSRYRTKDVSFNEHSFSFRSNFGANRANDSIVTSTVVNPNKAVLSLDEKGNILTFNDMAFQLLEYPPDKLSGMNFYHDILIHKKGCEDRTNEYGLEALGEVELCVKEKDQGGVLICGEVVDLITMNGNQLSMSLWIKEVSVPNINANENNDKFTTRKMAILEPVEQTVGTITISKEGDIIEMDADAEKIFQTISNSVKETKSIRKLIPSFELDLLDDISFKKKIKMKLSGITSDGIAFPLALSVAPKNPHFNISESFVITVWVYSNISGLMLLSKDGVMQTCNPTFIHLLLGYQASDIIGKKITSIIPEFYSDIELSDTFYSDHDFLDEKEAQIERKMEQLNLKAKVEQLPEKTDSVQLSKDILREHGNNSSSKKGKAKTRLDFSDSTKNTCNESKCDKENSFNNLNECKDEKSKRFKIQLSRQDDKENEVPDRCSPDEGYQNKVIDGSKMITSTPSQISSKTWKQADFFSDNKEIVKPDFVQLNEFPQGSFFGFGRHKDGSEINIMYQVCIVVIYE